jgi:hypothetical protein
MSTEAPNQRTISPGRGVAVRLRAHEEPAVVPGRRPDAVLDRERAAGAPRLVERRHRRGPSSGCTKVAATAAAVVGS